MECLREAGLQPYRFASPNRLVEVRNQDAFPICENVLAVRNPREAALDTGFEFEEHHVSTCAGAEQPVTH
jgi:hypothetical protein